MSNQQEKLSTVQELSQRLKVSTRTIQRWLHLGQIEALYVGRQLRFEEHEIKRFLDLRRRAKKKRSA
jgi:excisionase family DNA binding protein